MKEQIRNSIFETNSSSTHSLSICKNKVYNEWLDGKVKYSLDKDQFIEAGEADKINADLLKSENVSDFKDLMDPTDFYMTHEEFFDYFGYDYSTFIESSEGVTVFGYYGYC